MHEYGHHVQFIYDIANNPAGAHGTSTTVSPDLAHGEGWPTFFASIVMNSSMYNDTYTANKKTYYFAFDLETGQEFGACYLRNNVTLLLQLHTCVEALHRNYGEWGEMSVMALYWDLWDQDKFL